MEMTYRHNAGNSNRGLNMGSSMRALAGSAMAGLLFMASQGVSAQELEDIRAASIGGDRVQVNLQFSDTPPADIRAFAIDSPPRIAFDLPDAGSVMSDRRKEFNVGPLLEATAVESGDRTRVVLGLTQPSEYQTRVDGNNFIVTLGRGVTEADAQDEAVAERVGEPEPRTTRSARPVELTDIDFRRGDQGEGRVEVGLSRSGGAIDVREQAGRIEIEFDRAAIDESMERRLNVVDFATPVQTIDTVADGDRVRMEVATEGEYEVVSYQSDRQYVLEVAPMTEAERQAREEEEREFTGERLSLNFQDIEVRSVLQLLADFTDLNIVVSDDVDGNITLRLNNVPWDQALDIIMQSRGLDKRMEGNVLFVGPAEQIAARERQRMEAERDRQELEPLRTEFVQINFAQAGQIAELIRGEEDRFLSERGSMTVDSRTNTLLVQDTQRRIEDIRELVRNLDVQVQQVLVETRIVIAEDSFNRDLGARFGVTGTRTRGDTSAAGTGSLTGADQARGGSPDDAALANRLGSSLPADAANAGEFGFSILRRGLLLDLELSALQAEGRGEIISSPRVVTTNGQPAVIEQGQDIPIIVQDEAGNPNTELVEAYLSTEVTPQITPNGNVIMDIRVTKDEPGDVVFDDVTINRRAVETQVFVGDGETVVLGGVYEIDSSEQVREVPFLADIPFLGNFFRNRSSSEQKAELLIFVTPRVLD
ncbi:type IV pilus assembly protein PilQ [Thioalkalivibrio sp. ALE21]|uniref:type IV pilus secretin PilQ n=1 Tax=Thioalkalivibrio sp. ALE21 TaxID=1158175 RepID=UPI000D9AE58A|nr:type IV pilus secretin PilQ [Thioalkalivibrio sp. ALE21]PYG04249.1 type IV pilus assembly protein PilQ [Thioalkalivibrio sp. ALE21]